MFQAEARAQITALMTVAVYDRGMDGSAGGAHRAGLILGERPALEAWLDFHVTRCCSSAPA